MQLVDRSDLTSLVVVDHYHHRAHCQNCVAAEHRTVEHGASPACEIEEIVLLCSLLFDFHGSNMSLRHEPSVEIVMAALGI